MIHAVEPLIKATPDVGTPPLLRTLHYVPSVLYQYISTPEIRPPLYKGQNFIPQWWLLQRGSTLFWCDHNHYPCTLEPLYKGHHRGREFLASIERCPYLRGRFVLRRLLYINIMSSIIYRTILVSAIATGSRGCGLDATNCVDNVPSKPEWSLSIHWHNPHSSIVCCKSQM